MTILLWSLLSITITIMFVFTIIVVSHSCIIFFIIFFYYWHYYVITIDNIVNLGNCIYFTTFCVCVTPSIFQIVFIFLSQVLMFLNPSYKTFIEHTNTPWHCTVDQWHCAMLPQHMYLILYVNYILAQCTLHMHIAFCMCTVAWYVLPISLWSLIFTFFFVLLFSKVLKLHYYTFYRRILICVFNSVL